MINRKLQEINSSFFHPQEMQLDLLRNHPQAIPILAQWLYDEWKSYDASLTLEKLIHSLNQRLNSDKVPIAFVVLKDKYPVGCVSLKKELSPEFSDFPNDSVWLGALQVVPEQMRKGIGTELLKFSATIAKCLGYKNLYFYTSNPDKTEWYIKRDARLIDKRPFRDHTITIMQMNL